MTPRGTKSEYASIIPSNGSKVVLENRSSCFQEPEIGATLSF